MITIIGGGFSGLSAAYFLHRAGKDVTVLEWSRGLGGRASTRNVGYRTMDAGAQRLDLSPLSSNPLESDARSLLKAVAEERGVLAHIEQFPGPVYRFDGRSITTAQQVEVPNWSYLDGGMKVLAEALAKDIPVRTHTRISDIEFNDGGGYTLRNQRGEKTPSEGVIIALPAPYALALLQPHATSNKKVKKICDLLNEVHYEPMIGAIFGTTKINFKEQFTALFTDDVTAPVFWLSQEGSRRKLGIRKNENAFVLQLGAEISREYVLKSDSETFAAIERVFEEVLDVALPDVVYGEIQRWPAAFLMSSPFTVDSIKPSDFKTPLYLAGDYVAGQSSIASAFWSGKAIADKILGVDAAQFIAEPVRAQATLGEEDWAAIIPPARAPRKPHPKPKKKPENQRKERGKFGPARGSKPSQRGGMRPQGDRRPQRQGQGFGGGRPQGGHGGERQFGRGGDRGPGGFQRGPRPGGGGRPGGPREGGFQPRQGGYQQREGGYQPRQGGYQQREGGYQQRGGGGGGYERRGPQQGGWQGGGRPQRPNQGGYGGHQRQEGGYRPSGPREGGYQPRQGGYQQREGGYQQREGGYQPREGGYQQREGGYQRQSGGGGGNFRPRQSGRPQQGGGGYEQRDFNRPQRDFNQQGGGPQGGGHQGGGHQGGGGHRPVRGQVVYSTNNRPNPQSGGGGGNYTPRGGGNYEGGPLRREDEERRNLARNTPRRPRQNDDDNIGNR